MAKAVMWRALLTEARVAWVDKGRNVSKGNINIRCPWCANDPSHHLGIREAAPGYYCFRDPAHSGTNPSRLLLALRLGSAETARLLEKYGGIDLLQEGRPDFRLPPPSRAEQGWARFEPASDFPAALAYLKRRGFPYPAETCARFDLRYERAGKLAQRILIPYKEVGTGAVLGWTGRDVRPDAQRKYLTESFSRQVSLLTFGGIGADTVVAVEGPLDALKLADACCYAPEGFRYTFVAISGKAITTEKTLVFQALSRSHATLLLCMDADVPSIKAGGLLREVALSAGFPHYAAVRLPGGYKDPAEIPHSEVLSWLQASMPRTAPK